MGLAPGGDRFNAILRSSIIASPSPERARRFMYLVYVLTVLLLTYLAPALALRPQWLASSRSVMAIPIVSVAVVGLTKAALAALGAYNPTTVRVIALSFAVIALVRVTLWLRTSPEFDWPRTHRLLLGFAVLLGLSWAAGLGTSAFDTNDEIYSWNLWAMQHALGEPIDIYYTQAPYPQLFAVLVSWKYQLLGDFELQLPLRATLAVIPVVLWGTIAVAAPKSDAPTAWRSVLVMLLLVIAIGRWFGHGLADPLMAAALIVAIYCYLVYREAPRTPEPLLLSVVCAGVALLSKQPALIWALFSFPALVLLDTLRRRVPPQALVAPVTTVVIALAWIFGAGSGFENNQGVIDASQEERGLWGQLGFAIRELLIGQPLVLALLLAAGLAVLRSRKNRDVALLFLLPALLAWLIFGAYSLRLGIHVVACAALLLAVSGYALPSPAPGTSFGRLKASLQTHQRAIAIALVGLVSLASAWEAYRNIDRVGPTFSLYDGGPNAIARYFGKDTQVVLSETYDRADRLLWVPSNYIYGLYYARTPMLRPSKRSASDYTPGVLLAELARDQPDFLFDAGDVVPFGPANDVFRTLATEHCPDLFEPLATPPNRYGYTLYRMHHEAERLGRCSARLDALESVDP